MLMRDVIQRCNKALQVYDFKWRRRRLMVMVVRGRVAKWVVELERGESNHFKTLRTLKFRRLLRQKWPHGPVSIDNVSSINPSVSQGEIFEFQYTKSHLLTFLLGFRRNSCFRRNSWGPFHIEGMYFQCKLTAWIWRPGVVDFMGGRLLRGFDAVTSLKIRTTPITRYVWHFWLSLKTYLYVILATRSQIRSSLRFLELHSCRV
jgi:hypothetical protein